MLRGLFDSARGFIRELALNKIADHAFAGNGEGVSRWRTLREAVTTQGDVEAFEQSRNIAQALEVLQTTRTKPHDVNDREAQRAAIDEILRGPNNDPRHQYLRTWAGTGSKDNGGRVMTADDVLMLLDQADPQERAKATPKFSAESIAAAKAHRAENDAHRAYLTASVNGTAQERGAALDRYGQTLTGDERAGLAAWQVALEPQEP